MSLKSKKKYAMCDDPVLEMRSISWIIVELMTYGEISYLGQHFCVTTYTRTLLPDPAKDSEDR